MPHGKPTWIIGGLLLLAIIACGLAYIIGEKPDTGDRTDGPATADAESPAPEPIETPDASAEQPDMTYSEFLTGYSGYLDELAMSEGAYDALDYDGDGLNDRIYRSILDTNENGEAILIGYRIDFGNGDTLEVGGFDDLFTGVEFTGYDLTGDRVNEIIYCGLHGGSTFPPGQGSEIAVYTKTAAGYEMMPLPRPDDWEIDASPYRTGVSVYGKDVTEISATLYSDPYEYEETVGIDPVAYEYSFKPAAVFDEPVGSVAWGTDADTVDGAPALVLREDIGSKYFERDLVIRLVWRDGAFHPADMGLTAAQ